MLYSYYPVRGKQSPWSLSGPRSLGRCFVCACRYRWRVRFLKTYKYLLIIGLGLIKRGGMRFRVARIGLWDPAGKKMAACGTALSRRINQISLRETTLFLVCSV